VDVVIPGAQNLLRDQMLNPGTSEGAMLAAVAQAEEAFPKHILLSKLLPGIRFIKHGEIFTHDQLYCYFWEFF
jgi:hypothetical protein